MPFYRMFLDSVKRIEKNRFCNSNFNKLLQSIYHRKQINYKIIVRGVQFRIVYLLWGKHRIDIAYWYLFLMVTIYEFFYLTNTILFESWYIISHISRASLLDLLFHRFLLSEHWRNIWEPQQRQFRFRFCTRPCFKKIREGK